MRVLLDTTYARRGPSGTGIYIERLATALRGLGVTVLEAADERRSAPAGGGMRSVANLARDLRWTTLELPEQAMRRRADVLHHPLPALAPLCTVPQVVTVHDLAFLRLPECFDPRYRRWASLAHRSAARGADAVVAVSRTTARDLRARWGMDPAQLVVARHGPGQEPDAHRPHGDRADDAHLLYVGDDEPRKNVPGLLAGYARYRAAAGPDALPLVLAGDASARGVAGVREERRPDSERLADLYATAAALVHPSLHEGAGLTPLEAMSAGTPVLAARSPGVTETCGDAALYFDPHDPEALAGALARVTGDVGLRRDLAEQGRREAASASWARSAREHLRAYSLAIGVPGPA